MLSRMLGSLFRVVRCALVNLIALLCKLARLIEGSHISVLFSLTNSTRTWSWAITSQGFFMTLKMKGILLVCQNSYCKFREMGTEVAFFVTCF